MKELQNRKILKHLQKKINKIELNLFLIYLKGFINRFSSTRQYNISKRFLLNYSHYIPNFLTLRFNYLLNPLLVIEKYNNTILLCNTLATKKWLNVKIK